MRRMVVILLGIVASAGTLANAKELTVSEQEQATVGQICEIAAKSPAVPIGTTAQIAAWCVQWGERSKTTPAAPAVTPAVLEKK